jgi:hypothetical protein
LGFSFGLFLRDSTQGDGTAKRVANQIYDGREFLRQAWPAGLEAEVQLVWVGPPNRL